jgi:hypothetical protein
LPIWAAHVEARTEKRDWSPVGLATAEPMTSGNERWRLAWKPAVDDFRPGDTIQHRVVIYAGGIAPVPEIIGSLAFDPWWARLWREHQTAIIAAGAPFGLFALYAGGFFLVLLFAPAQLAGVGSAPHDGIPAPTGNVAFLWGLVRTLWESVLLLWLCHNRRVRRAWLREYAVGQSRLSDLGKFARERFVNEPEILDAWVTARLERVRAALDALELYGQRRIYVPFPVRMGAARIVERPDAATLRDAFARRRAVVCIVGSGGSGKSTLACAIARWAMADDPVERLAPQRMVPVFIVNDTTDLIVTVTRTVREMLGDEELPDDLIHGLLAQQRLLVIVDALSEREPASQEHVEEMFASAAAYNAVVITSRTEPQLRAVERTRVYPLLLDQKRIVPFIVDYVAQLKDAEPLQGGRTLLQLGDRILELAEAGGKATPVTPLLVTLFVASALSRAQAGLGLDSLPQDIPEIFIDYLKRVHAGPVAERGTAENEFIRATRVVARASLGTRMVPGDFSPGEATSALEAAGLSPRATALLEALTSGGVIEHRTLGGISILRFALDPVAEYLSAMQAVSDLRQVGRAEVAVRVDGLMEIEGYPSACDGYLRAFATCYRAYSAEFKLPDPTFPWEAQGEPLILATQNS